MRYARLENNKVMEVINFNPTGRFTEELSSQFIECDDSVQQHMIYNNNEFVFDLPSLDEVKKVKLQELNNDCKRTTLGTFTSSALGEPHTYSYDEEAQRNLILGKTLVDNYSDTDTINWRISDTRQVLPHTKSQFLVLFQDSVIHLMTNIEKFRLLESQVNSCTTNEEVELINW